MKDINKYKPSEFEEKWRSVWEKMRIYQPDMKSAKRPFYNLMMFPYPSAEGLHVGNMYAFTGADIFGRYKRMRGYDVFEPIGLDGFGIHSENYAIKIGKHPKEQAEISADNFYRQLKSIGNGFAFENKLETYDPEYYKWTQWIFIQMFKHGLAYRKKSAVNFCPSCKTVLSDEQVVNGVCERCKSIVEKKEMEEWFFRITAYAEKLLQNTYKDSFKWSERVKVGQRNWIGRSEGVRIEFRIQNSEFSIEVFTTAIDTIYGVTFMVISPQHPLINQLNFPNKNEVASYIKKSNKEVKTSIEKEKVKTGVDTGLFAINPINGSTIPLWIADYVLIDYGTGAVMGVPGHDFRDHEFAIKYSIPIIPTHQPKVEIKDKIDIEKDGFWDYSEIKTLYDKQSELINSDRYNGMNAYEAKKSLTEEIEKRGIGNKETKYKLRDWCISRQRYWGAPIPMVYCESCAKKNTGWLSINQKEVSSIKYQVLSIKKNDKRKIQDTIYQIPNTELMAGWYPVSEENLPVLLPNVKDWKPEGTGKGPLAKVQSFVKTICPNCSGEAERETDVCDTFLDSAWYFLRYPSINAGPGALQPQNHPQADPDFGAPRIASPALPWDKEITKKWLPVAQYTGGAEHTVLHLLYSRFVTMAFADWGYIDFEEPFSSFYAHGLIIAEGAKMSKSKGNVIVPDVYIDKYGSDTLRSYLMFLGPFDMGGDFRDTGIMGMYKFLGRVWRLVDDYIKNQIIGNQEHQLPEKKKKSDNKKIEDLIKTMHLKVKEITEDLEALRYNTAIAHIMEFVNELQKSEIRNQNSEYIKTLLLLLAPFAPHMAEELWQRFNGQWSMVNGKKFKSIHNHQWPEYDPKLLVEDEVTIVVQVNGKLRDSMKVISQKAKVKSEVELLARNCEKVKKHIEGNEVRKVIFVPSKLINFVV